MAAGGPAHPAGEVAVSGIPVHEKAVPDFEGTDGPGGCRLHRGGHRCWIVRRGDKTNINKKGTSSILKGYDSNGYSFFLCGNYRMKCTSVSPSGEIPNNDIPQFKLPTSNEKKSYIST